MAFYDKYTGLLRRIKPLYMVHNLMNRKYLNAHKSLYRKYRINKPTWFSISSKYFKDLPKEANEYTSKNEDWERDGYIRLNGFFDASFVEQINTDISNAIAQGTIDFNYTGKKILFAYSDSTHIFWITI